MKNTIKKTVAALIAFTVATQPAQAALLTLATQPIYLGAAIPPQVMITMTKDQQLHKKAYNDYSDLDGDGALETTYKHSINYYGYFDSFKCYTYSTTNSRFEPFGTTANKYCEGTNAGKWSGNFLNWVSMTRMDAVRKLLYGGMRSTDTATVTVLERSYLPTDAHAFAKYYSGKDASGTDDFHKLTPFTSTDVKTATNPTTSTNSHSLTAGSKAFTVASTTALAPLIIGDAIRVTATASTGNSMIGRVTAISGSTVTIDVHAAGLTGSGGPFTAWRVENLTQVGISFCNVTMGATSGVNLRSQTNTNPPLLKVAKGNFSLWSAMERHQCHWDEEISAPDKGAAFTGTRYNGNVPGASGIFSNASEPTTALHILGGTNFVVRVLACVSTLLGSEKCKEYNTNNAFKPVGLLQVYGDPGLIHFGLMMGSYNKNISGGVLRKNVGTFTNEVNADGTFITPAGGGIVNALNKTRIYGYYYGDGTYGGTNGDNCTFQLTNITQGSCRSWGNPMSEVYFESLRYFAGATSATAAFTTDDSAVLSGLTTATWPASSSTVLSNSNYCAPLNIVVFNSSVSTNEDDNQIGALSVINSSRTAKELTQTVGNSESGSDAVSGTNEFFYGKTPTLSTGDVGFELCSAKTAPSGGLGDVVGICPEGPTLGGTYLMSGLAYHAKTSRIRTDITAVPSNDTKSLKVTTYGVNLSTNVPTLPIKVSGDTNPRAILQPIYRLLVGGNRGGGALVDLKVVSQTVTATSNTGTVYLNWEDSEQGGDYDQDLWGVMSWCMQVGGDTASCPQNGGVTDTISITTDAIAESTISPQGFGYVINGTNKDGPHFHSGIENFSFTDPTNVTVTPAGFTNASGGCDTCATGDPATTVVYRLDTSGTARNLKDPLYYAAKYGGFKDSNSNDLPDLATEWDILDANGNPGSDGNPDNYFLVSNPLGLETSLNRVFLTILQTSSASSVATNSTSLQAGTKLYQARFNSNEWSGQVLAFPVASDGSVATTPEWDAGVLMNPSLTPSFNPNNRVIVTNTKGVVGSAPRGVAFRWPANPLLPNTSELTAAMVTALNTNPNTSTNDGRGSQRLDWLRGVSTNEGVAAGDLRRRQTSKLGDIVNSNPNFVGVPSAGHGDAAYAAFRLLHSVTTPRTPIVYAASNDGMLHGFDASSNTTKGQEVIAFMPSKALLKANKLTSQTYQHEYFVDGSPEVQDVCTTPHDATQTCTGWATYLAGTLGLGGQGVYMLDVTSPTGFTEANAQSIVKWEFTDADDVRMGYLFSAPIIRRTNSGDWYAIFSSGFNAGDLDGRNTTDGWGSIFMLKMSGPTGANGKWTKDVDYIRIDMPVGTVASPNGIGGVASFDRDGNGTSDMLYAGDLKGNLWRIDIGSATPTLWDDTGKRAKLFTAVGPTGLAQPITAPPSLAVGPNYTGAMVVFGTGRLLEPADLASGTGYQPNTLYGIWDKQQTLIPSITRSNLMQQKELAKEANGAYAGVDPEVASIEFSLISAYVPNYTATSRTNIVYGNTNPFATGPTASTSPQMGWFMDDPSGATTGERTIYRPELVGPFAVFVNAIPSAIACEGGGSEAQYVLETLTGGRSSFGGFDRDANGAIQSQSGSLLGDQSQFSLPTPSGSEPAFFFASRRETTGGFGQMTIMADAVTSASGGAGACAGAGLAPIGAQSFSSGLIGTQRLPGGCIGRVQWREIINH